MNELVEFMQENNGWQTDEFIQSNALTFATNFLTTQMSLQLNAKK